MSGPQIWLCLCTFRPIASKQLNGLTTMDTLSWLGGAVVTHLPWVTDVPERVFMFDFLYCCCCVFTFCPKTHYFSQKFAIPFTMLIYFVYLTYCEICDRLYGYKDTDLASKVYQYLLLLSAIINSPMYMYIDYWYISINITVPQSSHILCYILLLF